VKKSVQIVWAGYVADIGKGEGHKCIRLRWVWRALLRHWRGWENNIKMDLIEEEWERME